MDQSLDLELYKALRTERVQHTLENGWQTFLPIVALAVLYVLGSAWGAITVYRLGPDSARG